jgi:predicted Zn-dependent protease
LNPPAYENAFYAAAHEFGHTMGLPHTDDYLVTALPSNWKDSVMYNGAGTDSLLLNHEVLKLLTFLNGW